LIAEESIAAEPFKNAIKLFESLDILQIETTDSPIKKIRLSPEYNNAEALNDVILKIEDFKK
jgi:hypothetical protein